MSDIIQDVSNAVPEQTEQKAPSAWYSGIEDENLRGYTEKKGWKTPQDAVSSYKNLESKLGNAIHLPTEKSTPDEINAFYTKLGRPEKPEGYALPVPEGEDGSFAQNMSKIMYDAGIPAKSAQTLAAAWNEYQAQQRQSYANEQAKIEEQQIQSLKQEWGAKYQTNEAIAKNAASAFGVTGEQIDALQKVMGFDGAMKFFQGLGAKIGEDKFIGGQGQSARVMTKEEAQQEYNKFMGNSELYDKWVKGDKEANDIWTNIMTALGKL